MNTHAKLFLVRADAGLAEITGLQTLEMKDTRDRGYGWIGMPPEPAKFDTVEMLVAQGEQESEGFALVKAMKEGDPFNIELHTANGKVISKSYKFYALVDETRIDDPAQFYRITVYP